MGVIAKYKFDSSLCANFIPEFNSEFTGYTTSDVDNGDNTITRTIESESLPTLIRFGSTGNSTNREKSLLEVIECDGSQITSISYMFNGCASLTSLNLSKLNTSQVTNMSFMFNSCTKLTSLVTSNFDTSQVTNMSYMFCDCISLTFLDLSNWNTSQVTTMTSMFTTCKELTSLDLSSFNTKKVTNMSGLFNGCNRLTTLDLSNFDISQVTNIGGIFNACPSLSNIGLLYASTSTINTLLTHLETTIARNIYYTDANIDELTVQNNITYKEYKMTQATFPYTLNKLPNGVADYIDVVNKVHVQRVGCAMLDGSEDWNYGNPGGGWANGNTSYGFYSYDNIKFTNKKQGGVSLTDKFITHTGSSIVTDESKIGFSLAHINYVVVRLSQDMLSDNNPSTLQTYLASNPITVLYELETPIYTPLTEEEIAQLPLSAYADGYVNLSSDQLMPSFEFRMKASNRYQVDMLETGYYYLNAPVGNVKLGTANVDVQQMPCIVKVDNVGTGDSGYRLSTSDGYYKEVELTIDGYYVNINNGELLERGDRATSDYIYIDYYENICVEDLGNREYFDMVFYDENKKWISFVSWDMVKNYGKIKAPKNAKYFRFSIIHKGNKIIKMFTPITLAKLPSHRIPTSFTQGMKCGTDFGYWEGIKVATGKQLYISETNKLDFAPIELNRIEYHNTIVEDEFDIATGKITKHIGKYTIDGNSNLWGFSVAQFETATHMSFCCSSIPNFKKGGRCVSFLGLKIGAPNSTNSEENWSNLGVSNSLYFRFKKDRYSYYGNGINGVKAYFNTNPTTIYYELEVPEISYINLSSNEVKTVANSTIIQSSKYNQLYLNPQVKPSHLTYPVPSLVGNRTYTVVHNRKNITGSTKPIELNLGGTVVQLNDASSKTLVKTPSTLAHSNLIFIGGESTVDHIMVLDGDWTNKPIEYFENMKGHDTDAIITIIGDGKIDDVAEQYLW